MKAQQHNRSRQASNILPLNDVIPLARSLARKEAHTPDDIDDLVQVGLFAYHKAELRHQLRGMMVEKPMSLARTTLQRAIRGYYWQQREWQGRGEPNKNRRMDDAGVGIETSEHTFFYNGSRQVEEDLAVTMNGRGRPLPVAGLDGQALDRNGDQCELLELDDYFNALERKCGAKARLIVENLLMPSGECCARILDEVRGKRECQEEFKGKRRSARRHQPRGVKKEIRISHRLIRDAMQISPTEWVRSMESIREFTRGWVGR